MRTEGKNVRVDHFALGLVLMAAPLVLGAKGCDRAVVGDDHRSEAGAGAETTGGDAGMGASTTSGGATATGGTSGTAAKGGSDATGGSGGSGAKGGSGGSVATGGSPGTGGTSGSAGMAGTAGSAGMSGGTACGGLQGLTCATDEYCDFAPDAMCGQADQLGTCSPRPGGCTTDYQPVCGCDGTTYSNACTAHMQGVSVASDGACPGKACGARAGNTCSADEYCAFAPDVACVGSDGDGPCPAPITPGSGCGASDGEGTCTPVPTECSDIYAPVCGCDGMTYPTPCAAHQAGASIASRGACTGDPCDGETGCDANSFCDFSSTVQCGRRGDSGVCTTKPQGCDDIEQPVCGCDGMTYTNECFAQVAGTSVASTGACLGGDTCGGVTGATCPSEQFCNFPIAAMCGSGDQTGTCTLSGGIVCSDVVMEVCGCDGKTYPNACYALRAQVSVAANGACPAP